MTMIFSLFILNCNASVWNTTTAFVIAQFYEEKNPQWNKWKMAGLHRFQYAYHTNKQFYFRFEFLFIRSIFHSNENASARCMFFHKLHATQNVWPKDWSSLLWIIFFHEFFFFLFVYRFCCLIRLIIINFLVHKKKKQWQRMAWLT